METLTRINDADFTVTVPEGQSGAARVTQITVSVDEAKFANLREATHGSRRFITAGTYTQLFVGHQMVMSDTPSERQDHYEPVRRASGRCLVNGLGIGMVAQAILRRPEVESLTVVELHAGVIALVGDHYRQMFGERLTIVHADALTYRPKRGETFDMVWHDIWPDICADSLDEIELLKRRYAKRCEWQGAWCETEVRRQARRYA